MTGVKEVLAGLVGQIGGQPRPGQLAMAEAVDNAVRERRSLLVQAGTGTGKSFAYLVPAALWALTADRPVVISTATLALQRQLLAKDLPAVGDALTALGHRPPRAAVVKGRSNYLCRLRLQESGGGQEDALFDLPGRLEQQAASVRRWAEETDTGDRDDLPTQVDARVWGAFSVSGRQCVGRQKCPVGADCHAELARDRAGEADLVVTNHSLLAIDAVGEVPVLPERDLVVVDEAHELAARFTQASTQALTAQALADFLRLAAGLVGEGTAARCAQAGDAFRLAMMRTPEGRLSELPAALVAALALVRDSHHEALTSLSGSSEAGSLSRRQVAIAAATEVHDRAGILLASGDDLVRWATADPSGLSCAPLTVAGQIRTGLLERSTVVATSATLKLGGSFSPTALELGLGPAESGTYEALDVGSPFDYGSQGILYLPSDLPAPHRDGISAQALTRIRDLVEAAGGRTLVLAASWRSVDAVAEALADGVGEGFSVLVQERGVPVGPLVAQFAGDERSVLVGTMSLWQGVDVPGPSCTCVVIEKIPFPRPDDPILSARTDRANASGRSGFATVSLPQAALLLAQGSGRLIRTSSDRGVVAILDSRIATRTYGRYLVDSLPQMWRTSDTAAALGALARLRAASDLAQDSDDLAHDPRVVAVDGLE